MFVPGSNGFIGARGLFGGSARRLVAPSARIARISGGLAEQGVLIALAATAMHAIASGDGTPPDLIVGHGVLGRLLARIAVGMGAPAPTVWETNPVRRGGAQGYVVLDPATDARRDYRAIYDASGDAKLLDTLIGRITRGGEIVLAGFYDQPLSFTFPPAFMREARIRVAAEWRPDDLTVTLKMIEEGRLPLDGLITHRAAPGDAAAAYRTAFTDQTCLKLVLDWSRA